MDLVDVSWTEKQTTWEVSPPERIRFEQEATAVVRDELCTDVSTSSKLETVRACASMFLIFLPNSSQRGRLTKRSSKASESHGIKCESEGIHLRAA